ncbi:FtsX-like permease family protein [Kutzneria sp. 744]|uniref:FtsX-like permease family protein n=1 Tax=Kutzneria sp. (strain 744) TaxID=345341 RepID=UPI0003EEDAF6|nr:FtsX-like permease family protein [Kutzneria sp. 744]EWM19431.1 ABC transporter integral membrane protein [Kutzneria sp. 744]
MLKATLRDLFAHKGRVAMTIVAVALGVAATVASWVVSDSVAATLVHADIRTDVGISVPGPLNDVDRGRLAALPGVTRTTSVVSGRAGLVGPTGKLVDVGTLPEQAGTDWDDSGRFVLVAGRAPARAGEIAVSSEAGVPVGDRTRVLLARGQQNPVTVVGVFRYRTLGPDEPSPVVAFSPASTVLGATYSRIEVTGADVAAVRALYPKAATGNELALAAQEQAAGDAEDLRETLLPFAAVALLVGTFVIANTFTMLITQRTRQYALLRAVGAYRRQVRRSVLVEAVALVVTTLSAYGSARRAATVPPVAALRLDAGRPELRRGLLGLLALVAGVIAVMATLDPGADTTERIVAIGGAIVGAVGILLLAPVLAGASLRPLIALTRRLAGPAMRLGVQNAARDPRRTAGTATAITVGLGLVCAFGTLSATLTALIGSADRVNIPVTTTILEPAAGRSATVDAADLGTVRALPGVTEAAAARNAIADVGYAGGTTRFRVTAIEPSALGTVLTPQLTAGTADLRRGVVISQNQADMMGVRTGDTLTLGLGASTVRTVVEGVYRATELQSSLYFDVARAPAEVRDRPSLIYAAGPNARAAVEAAFRGRPDVVVAGRDDLVAADIAAQALAFVVIDAMFGVAIVIGVFGVVNTLVLSVLERTREIGLTRAVGASRRLIRRMITVESLVISLFGALLGILVGVAVGAVMQHAMLGQELLTFSVPVDAIGLSLVGIVLAGVLAALWPAQRAARTDVLSAIAG